MIRRYETLFVLHPELPEAQNRETIERAKRLIEDGGAQLHGVQEWGMRDLAYPIRKLHRGYYVLVEYSSTAEVVRELERTLRIADEVLRFVSVAAQAASPKEQSGKPRGKQEPVDLDAAPME
jgi:small subunit ribosomal protein S6